MFKFQEPGPLVDAELELILTDIYSGNTSLQRVPVYQFNMTVTGRNDVVGKIDLRVGNTPEIMRYSGHIGYEVAPAYRGHHYAARSVGLLIPLARSHDLDTLWITCDPDNWASRRTCELAGFVFVEIVDLPEHSEMAGEAPQQKCRYRFKL